MTVQYMSALPFDMFLPVSNIRGRSMRVGTDAGHGLKILPAISRDLMVAPDGICLAIAVEVPTTYTVQQPYVSRYPWTPDGERRLWTGFGRHECWIMLGWSQTDWLRPLRKLYVRRSHVA